MKPLKSTPKIQDRMRIILTPVKKELKNKTESGNDKKSS